MEMNAAGAAPPNSRHSAAGNELQAFAAMLARGKWIIIGVTLLAAVNAALLSVTKPKTFDATVLLRVQASAATQSSSNDIVQANKSIASTYTTLFTDRGFLASAAKSIGHGTTLDDLDHQISAKVEGDTELIELRATGRTPAAATQTVRQVANYAVNYVNDLDNQQSSRIADLNRRRNQLTSQIQNARRQAGQTQAQFNDTLSTLRQERTALINQ